MGYPYFRCREQVVRLMMKRYKEPLEVCLRQKAEFGIRFKIFKEPFALTRLENGKWLNYKLKWYLSFSKDAKYGQKFREIYRERLLSLMELQEGDQGSYMVTAFYYGGIRHAFAIVKD